MSYKIKVKVELVECNGSPENGLTRHDDGAFSQIIEEKDAISIDHCERAILSTAHPTIREAISRHLSEISEKKTREKGQSGPVTINPTPYRVDGEVGRFQFITHNCSTDELEYNTAHDLFPQLHGKEIYKTSGFKEIAMIYGDIENSYRKTADLINRVRYQCQGGTPYRTLQESTEKEGSDLIHFLEEKATHILQDNGFNESGVYQGPEKPFRKKLPVTLHEKTVAEAVAKCSHQDSEDILKNPVPYEDPQHTVNIAADDVCVKKQEETRQNTPETGKRQYVHNSVIHVFKGDQSYTLNSYSIKSALCFLLAFLFHNNLLGNRFQFFTDGHKSLNQTILKQFKWFNNIGIILDWYHLTKKIKEQLSLGMKGRTVRNQLVKRVLPLLWYGLTDKAIGLLQETDSHDIKNQATMDKLIQYLVRNKPYIPCYAVRKKLGLRNSSSIGEKMNDLLVSIRQKHNGMSWSKDGSLALATVTALKFNQEYSNWFEKRELDFKLDEAA